MFNGIVKEIFKKYIDKVKNAFKNVCNSFKKFVKFVKRELDEHKQHKDILLWSLICGILMILGIFNILMPILQISFVFSIICLLGIIIECLIKYFYLKQAEKETNEKETDFSEFL
jgi:hypothetical protein